MALEPPYPRHPPGRQYLNLLAHGQGAVDQGAGDHGPEAGHGKGAIDGEARSSGVLPGLGGLQQLVQGAQKLRQAVAGHGGYRDHGSAIQGSALEHILHLRHNKLDYLFVHKVLLGYDNQALSDAQQVKDGEMLSGLRHHRLVGSDHQHCQVYGADSGQHVL